MCVFFKLCWFGAAEGVFDDALFPFGENISLMKSNLDRKIFQKKYQAFNENKTMFVLIFFLEIGL